MDKVKRGERMAVMAHILTSQPNRLFSLNCFCDMFDSAKSSVSEDLSMLAADMQRYGLGTVETLAGAAGGVRYRPVGTAENDRSFILSVCDMLMQPDRRLPGGYLYFSDILSDPQLVSRMGSIIASRYYDRNVDFVLTMETKGIPVALMAASALRVPLIIARHKTRVYEGSAVNINYVTGSGNIESMSLSRRAVQPGQHALIVDDFMRGGGTAGGMVSLMKEFGVSVEGLCFVLAMAHPKGVVPENMTSLMLMEEIENDKPTAVYPTPALFGEY